MDTTVVTYGVYLAITLALTAWVASTLFRNGRRFLVDVFRGDEDLADSVNHLLVVGFYLINVGYVCLVMRVNGDLLGLREAVETLAVKVGVVMLVLGVMHFFNVYIFSRLRVSRRRQELLAAVGLAEPPAPGDRATAAAEG